MSSEFPKLQKKLTIINWEITQIIEKMIQNGEIEDIEIDLSSISFVPRSPASKSAFYLRDTLDVCWNSTSEKIRDSSKLSEEHILAAQALIKLRKYQETAVSFLTRVLTLKLDTKNEKLLKDGTEDEKKLAKEEESRIKSLRKLASEAILSCGSEISELKNSNYLERFIFNDEIVIVDGKRCVRTDDGTIVCKS